MEPTLLQKDSQGNKAAPFDFKNIPGFDLEEYGRSRVARMMKVCTDAHNAPGKPIAELDDMLREEIQDCNWEYSGGIGFFQTPGPLVEGRDYFIDPVNRSIVAKGPGEYIGMPRLCSDIGWLGDDLKPIPGKPASLLVWTADGASRMWDAFGNEVKG